MDKKEAIRAVLDGKKVKHKSWESNVFIFLDDDIGFRKVDDCCDVIEIDWNDYIDSDNWELYEEPKKEAPEYIDLELEKDEGGWDYFVSPNDAVVYPRIGISHWVNGVEYELFEYMGKQYNPAPDIAFNQCIMGRASDGSPMRATHARFYRKDLIK